MSYINFRLPKHFELIPVNEDAIWHVASTMCEGDANEVMASTGLCPYDALVESVKVSTLSRTTTYKGVPITIGGLAVLTPTLAAPWHLRTVEALQHVKSMLRIARSALDEQLAEHPFLANVCDLRNEDSLTWLKWLGFSFGTPVPHGPQELPFVPFWIRSPGVHIGESSGGKVGD